jgi:integrase
MCQNRARGEASNDRKRPGWYKCSTGRKDANENKGGEADDGTNVPPGLAKGDGGDRRGAQGALGLKPSTLEPIAKGLAERWRDKAVSEVTADDIHHLVDEIRERGIPGLVRRNGGESDSVARVSHARLSKFFSWAIERRLIAANPCTGVWRPDVGPARDRVVTDDEVRWFWLACSDLGSPFGPLFKLLLLTGQRRDEVAGMAWAELSDDHASWSLPGERTKNKRAHSVPLPQAARDLIASVRPVGTGYVFTTTGVSPVSGWSKTKKRLDEKMLEVATKDKPDAVIPVWVTHDLRRTCATGLQKLGVRLEVTEAVLNHASGARAGIVAVYQRHQYLEEKREALEKWSAHVERIISGQAADVIALRRARR